VLLCKDIRDVPSFAPACERSFTEASFLQQSAAPSASAAASAGVQMWNDTMGACVSSDVPMGEWIVVQSSTDQSGGKVTKMYAVGVDTQGRLQELLPITNTTVASATAVSSQAGFFNLGTAKTSPANAKSQNFPTKSRGTNAYTWNDGRCHVTRTYGSASVSLAGSTGSNLTIHYAKITVCKKRTNCADSSAQSTAIDRVESTTAQERGRAPPELGTQRKLLARTSNPGGVTQKTCCIVKKMLVSCRVGNSKCSEQSVQDRDSLQTIATGLF